MAYVRFPYPVHSSVVRVAGSVYSWNIWNEWNVVEEGIGHKACSYSILLDAESNTSSLHRLNLNEELKRDELKAIGDAMNVDFIGDRNPET